MVTTPSPLLADRFAPRPEFGRTDLIVVDADPATAWKSLRGLDLTELRGGLAALAVWVRDAPERVRGRPARTPTRLTWNDLDAGTDWMILGENPGQEIVLAAVGKFWRPVVKWMPCEPRDFPDFAEPGYGKVVWSFTALPYGDRRTLFSSEIRVTLTDPRAWVSFRRYWRISTPAIALIARSVLRTAKNDAERP
ncbi:hypothetical protein SK854_04850 [Lentzea sp. BCCO 10_0061]|uniref:Polyketide cyclase / dehydrase and lipid transport n=1 Tax=Lentzea sokolovensis TaxID=3095429 RepID=A0ABU4UPL0_9PSEU|nr:hypothetical protein [Lentzea sp. BCCO 10_0061]MDX8141430.1 hypothetical protein [Lentzea sp. BCCO 10_0061]